MGPNAPSTAFIVARRALDRACGEECVHWAEALLEQGRDGNALRMLTGLTGELNHFEVAELRDRAVTELGVPMMDRESALRNLAAEWLQDAGADLTRLWQAVGAIRELAIAGAYPDDLLDFYLMAYAHDEMRDEGEQHHWPGVTTSAELDTHMRVRATSFVAQCAETSNRPRYTRAEVADIIERFLDGSGGEWEWDDFISVRLPDPELDAVRERCAHTREEGQAEQWCGPTGLDELRRTVAELRERHSAFKETIPKLGRALDQLPAQRQDLFDRGPDESAAPTTPARPKTRGASRR